MSAKEVLLSHGCRGTRRLTSQDDQSRYGQGCAHTVWGQLEPHAEDGAVFRAISLPRGGSCSPEKYPTVRLYEESRCDSVGREDIWHRLPIPRNLLPDAEADSPVRGMH